MPEQPQQPLQPPQLPRQPTQAAVEAGSASAEEQLKPKAKRKPSRRKFRLKPFDKTLLAALREGESNAMAIAQKLNVDVNEFERRLTTLVNQKLVARDTSSPSLIHLTVKGFEAYAPRAPRVSRAPRAEAEKQPLEEKLLEAEPTEAPREKPVDAPAKRLREPQEPSQVPAPQPAVKTQVLDLLEQQRQSKKQAPATTPAPAAAPAASAAPTVPAHEAPAPQPPASERCELCKKPFKLSVSNAGEAKYGHCFCGAAYHKDCYESLLENNSKCVRCDKKLRLILDKRSEEAVKQVKELF